MTRDGYGLITKNKVKRVVEVLLHEAYAGNKPTKDIKYDWKTENILYVRTTVAYIESLTAQKGEPGWISQDDIRKALNNYLNNNFLGILTDKREVKQGSKVWEFTLTLWSQDTAENLNKLDELWELKRPEKGKKQEQILLKAASDKSHSQPTYTEHPEPMTWFPEGSVPFNSPFYIERPPIEEQCYKQVLQPFSLIRIRAPKLMGKTSLMTRIRFHAARRGYKTAQLNFDGADSTTLANQRELLGWLWSGIARELKLENQVADWDDMVSLNLSCTAYFEDYLLSKIQVPLVLCLDQIDKLFPYEKTAPNFFGLLRAWHEKGKNCPLWQKFRLVVTYATDAYIPLNDKQSPFNVGMEVGLPDFTDEQILELAIRHNLNWSEEQISELSAMVGGHPHLVRRAMYKASQESLFLKKILQDAPTYAGIYSKHLCYYWEILNQQKNLFEAFTKVVKSPKSIVLSPEETRDLESLGLIKKEGNRVHLRYKLYHEFFREFL